MAKIRGFDKMSLYEQASYYVPRSLLAAAISFFGAKLFAAIIDDWRKKQGLPAQKAIPHHSTLGIGMITASAFGPDNEFAPWAVGLGAGLIVEDIADLPELQFLQPLQGNFRGRVARSGDLGDRVREHARRVGLGDDQSWKNWDIHQVNIPDIAPAGLVYQTMTDAMASLILHDTYNRKLHQTIPAGYRHPAVIHLTHSIIQERGLTSYDPIGVLRAFQDWAWQRTRGVGYANDPELRGVTDGEDMYFHPYLVIDEIERKGKMAVDCDDMDILLCSMMLSVGIPCRIMLYAQDPRDPDKFNHTCPAAYLPPEMFPNVKPQSSTHPYYVLECTENRGYFYEPQYVRRAEVKLTV